MLAELCDYLQSQSECEWWLLMFTESLSSALLVLRTNFDSTGRGELNQTPTPHSSTWHRPQSYGHPYTFMDFISRSPPRQPSSHENYARKIILKLWHGEGRSNFREIGHPAPSQHRPILQTLWEVYSCWEEDILPTSVPCSLSVSPEWEREELYHQEIPEKFKPRSTGLPKDWDFIIRLQNASSPHLFTTPEGSSRTPVGTTERVTDSLPRSAKGRPRFGEGRQKYGH